MVLADVLTVAGVAASAAVVTGVIQLLKSVLPAIDNGREKLAALLLSAVLVVLAVVDSGAFGLPALFTAFLAWLSIAKLATGIYDEVTGQPGSFREDGVDSP
jgi:hypothetical protein